jgi:AsmA protein
MDIVSTVNVNVNNMPPFSVHLYGMLDDPQHKLDTKALTKHIVQNVLTNIIDKAKNGKGKPEDIIKGIIGLGNKKKANSTDDQQGGEENTGTRKEDSNPANILIKKGLKGLFK